VSDTAAQAAEQQGEHVKLVEQLNYAVQLAERVAALHD